jgi:hypothetical protein
MNYKNIRGIVAKMDKLKVIDADILRLSRIGFLCNDGIKGGSLVLSIQPNDYNKIGKEDIFGEYGSIKPHLNEESEAREIVYMNGMMHRIVAVHEKPKKQSNGEYFEIDESSVYYLLEVLLNDLKNKRRKIVADLEKMGVTRQ